MIGITNWLNDRDHYWDYNALYNHNLCIVKLCRYGRKTVVVGAGLAEGIGGLVSGFLRDYHAYIAVRAIMGFFSLGYVVAMFPMSMYEPSIVETIHTLLGPNTPHYEWSLLYYLYAWNTWGSTGHTFVVPWTGNTVSPKRKYTLLSSRRWVRLFHPVSPSVGIS